LDPEKADEDEEIIGVVWSAGINGLLESSDSNTENRIKNTIQQAFDQSEYLKK
jgi:hypothetical protein